MKINNQKIGRDYPPYIIAEMSANHNGSIETAFKLIDEAKKAGASAVKIQTYTQDTITINSKNSEFKITGGLWDGRYLYDLYKEGSLPWDWHKDIFAYAQEKEITIFSSPFDFSAVDLLEEINTPAYKIASFELVDIPLIKYVASTGKPMILSTGMANKNEIQEAIEAAQSSGCDDLALLHCVSGYPTPAGEYNLRTIEDMINTFGLTVGLSDHTLDNFTAYSSIALGASIIEKHFALNPADGGLDSEFSLNPAQLKELCYGSRLAWDSLGKVDYSCKSSEAGNIKFRRSLYAVKDIKAGEKFTKENIRSIRPGYGIEPKFFEDILGKRSLVDIKSETAIKRSFFEK